jgi:hypothetical protein
MMPPPMDFNTTMVLDMSNQPHFQAQLQPRDQTKQVPVYAPGQTREGGFNEFEEDELMDAFNELSRNANPDMPPNMPPNANNPNVNNLEFPPANPQQMGYNQAQAHMMQNLTKEQQNYVNQQTQILAQSEPQVEVQVQNQGQGVECGAMVEKPSRIKF